MSEADSKKFARRTQDHLNGYIKFADQKASILLTAQLAFIGLYSNIIKTSWENSASCFKLASAITILFGLIATGLAGWTIYPRTPDTQQGLMLWSGIKDMGETKYKKKIKSLESDDVFDEILDENHKLAIVAENKYRNLRISLISTGLMLLFALLAVILLL
ncbi:hypothetical protein G3A49_13370 [Haloferax volcanii]|uniref:Pycsar effector protein domain-containing protein n=1 Tax=Haloferax volcanii TaxID=2246 RepID=A0A6C0V1D2_HALVO|nr:Pycsar system effector family protein [Haloferax alexandrinus]QIB79068.1 hypothetical protein G3A49_13370 [Haloferax alexandrinus]